MAGLVRHGIIDVVIAQDSDFVAYNVPVLTKMSKRGQGILYTTGAAERGLGVTTEQVRIHAKNTSCFLTLPLCCAVSQAALVAMICGGCDYYRKPGMRLATALKEVRKCPDPNDVIKMVRQLGKMS